jgi:hypothetical protein
MPIQTDKTCSLSSKVVWTSTSADNVLMLWSSVTRLAMPLVVCLEGKIRAPSGELSKRRLRYCRMTSQDTAWVSGTNSVLLYLPCHAYHVSASYLSCLSYLVIHDLILCSYAVDLVVCVALGVDMFDCVFPTRTAVSHLHAWLSCLLSLRGYSGLATLSSALAN